MSPFQKLLQSRKFLIAVLDLVVGLVGFVVARFAPAYAEDIKELIVMVQPVVLLLIGAIAIEDAAAKFNGK